MGDRSRYRKEGYHAFTPEGDPEECCPYSTGWPYPRECWIIGWYEANQEYDANQEEQKQEDDQWDQLQSSCPWHGPLSYSGDCIVTKEICTKENCAPYHFITNQRS